MFTRCFYFTFINHINIFRIKYSLLFISGSHRLNVRDPNADIDTICIAPNFVTREHFFTILKEELIPRDSPYPVLNPDFKPKKLNPSLHTKKGG